MRKFFCLILCLFIFISSVRAGAVSISEEEIDLTGLPKVSTAAEGDIFELNSKGAILLEQNSLEPLYEENADEKLEPASVTKIMSLLLVIEAIDKGMFALDTIITTSDTAARMGGSQIWLEPGEQMTVSDLLKAVFVVSANDATVALAEEVAGSEESFVSLMNERAKELNMQNTNFINSTGLHAENHYTSARDIAIMASELMKHEIVTTYSTIWMDTLRNGESELTNTNKLIRFYEGATGLKTGTTEAAGYCLCATATRKGLNLIAVVMGADSSKNRFADAQKLLNYGFANYSIKEIPIELPDSVNVKGGVKPSVALTAEDVIEILIKNKDSNKITYEINLSEEVPAPISKGDILGSLTVKSGDETLSLIDITADENVEKIGFKTAFISLLYHLLMI